MRGRNKMIHKKLTSIGLILIISLSILSQACDKDKVRQLAKVSDDMAQAQKSIANLVASARDTGELTAGDVNLAKGILIEINDANGELINIVKAELTDGNQVVDRQTEILKLTQRISASIVRLNNLGLSRIKSPEKRAA